ncbi:MAG: trypsin-like peptidase domain-containing protein [Methylophilaceae bacterium]
MMIRKLIAFAMMILMHQHLLAESRNEMSYRLKSSVVKVHVATKNGGHGVGSGVAIGKDLIATNCHVLANSVGVKVTKFGDGLVPVALKADWKHDLCILRFQFAEFTPVELGDSEQLQYEQEVFSIGFPGGPPKPQYTEGKIKALYPLEDSVIIRTDASFVMGASGSPIFDVNGKLLGISTFKSPGKHAYYYNVPVKWVKALLNQPDLTSMETDQLPFWDAPEETRPFFMRVVLPYKYQKWDELDKIAKEWIASETDSVEGYYYAGLAAEKLGNISQARTYYQQALSLKADHPPALAGIKCVEEIKLACNSQF